MKYRWILSIVGIVVFLGVAAAENNLFPDMNDSDKRDILEAEADLQHFELFFEIPKYKYNKVFAAPKANAIYDETTMHSWVIEYFKTRLGYMAVPGYIATAEVGVDGLLKKAEVPKVIIFESSGRPIETQPKAVTGGAIKLKYKSPDLYYDYLDFGNEKIIWERIVRWSADGNRITSKAIKKDGVYYLKTYEENRSTMKEKQPTVDEQTCEKEYKLPCEKECCKLSKKGQLKEGMNLRDCFKALCK